MNPPRGATASFAAAVGLQWLQLLLVAPDELDVGDVDDVAGLDTQSSRARRRFRSIPGGAENARQLRLVKNLSSA